MNLDELNPLGFLVHHEAWPAELELRINAQLFLATLMIYFIAFLAKFYIVATSAFIALYIYAYCMYHNLRDLNAGWEKRRADEAEAATPEESEDDADKVQELPADESESELEDGEIRENKQATEDLEVSDDSQDEDLPPLIPAS